MGALPCCNADSPGHTETKQGEETISSNGGGAPGGDFINVPPNAATGYSTGSQNPGAQHYDDDNLPPDQFFHTPAPPPPGGLSPPSDADAPGIQHAERSPPQGGPPPEAGDGEKVAGGSITMDLVLSDLETAESIVYGEVFMNLDDAQNGLVPLDHALLPDLLQARTAIEEGEMDQVLQMKAKKVGGKEVIDVDAFCAILREHAVSEMQVTNHFFSLGDGEAIGSEECRNGLHIFVATQLQLDIPQARWDRVLDASLIYVEAQVDLEQWTELAKRVSRIVRLIAM